MARFFTTPFAASAAKTTIPETDNESVSWKNGYTAFYEYDPTAKDSKAKHIERDAFNTLFYEVTSSIQAIQLAGIAPYYSDVTATSGPGYAQGAVVTYANKIWRSKVANNRILPNETTTANWEQIFGYDSLVAQLKKDGVIGGSSSGGTSNGYTKSEIDDKISIINSTMKDYLYKEPGEIFLLSWCDADRNSEGFFICNGDKLPYSTGTPANEKEYYGTQLYELSKDTDFNARWKITVDTSAKMVQLPNILAGVSDKQTVMLGLKKETAITNTTTLRYFSSGEVTSEAEKLGNIVYQFNLVPCMYLGRYGEDS